MTDTKMGITNIVEYTNNRKNRQAYKSIYGDTLEALIGAIYLDKGYMATRRFIVRKLLSQQYDLEKIIRTNPNYKSSGSSTEEVDHRRVALHPPFADHEGAGRQQRRLTNQGRPAGAHPRPRPPPRTFAY